MGSGDFVLLQEFCCHVLCRRSRDDHGAPEMERSFPVLPSLGMLEDADVSEHPSDHRFVLGISLRRNRTQEAFEVLLACAESSVGIGDGIAVPPRDTADLEAASGGRLCDGIRLQPSFDSPGSIFFDRFGHAIAERLSPLTIRIVDQREERKLAVRCIRRHFIQDRSGGRRQGILAAGRCFDSNTDALADLKVLQPASRMVLVCWFDAARVKDGFADRSDRSNVIPTLTEHSTRFQGLSVSGWRRSSKSCSRSVRALAAESATHWRAPFRRRVWWMVGKPVTRASLAAASRQSISSRL